jgi:hypothetical protein
MVSVAWKLSTIEERRKEHFFYFGEEFTGTKVANPKTVAGSSLDEDVGLRYNNNIQR